MMTDTTKWGAPIPVNGKRPAWLGESDCYAINKGDHSFSGAGAELRYWPCVTTIRLPADHWAYTAINAGFEPWAGGDKAPADWDGGDVLHRDSAWDGGIIDWADDAMKADIIGYHKRVDESIEVSDDDYVRIKRVTVMEFDAMFEAMGWQPAMEQLGYQWADPTPAERIASETGIALDIVERVLAAS